jgi:hypothetical protein
MALLNESEARTILQKVLALSKADECEVNLTGARRGKLRFAQPRRAMQLRPEERARHHQRI